MIALDLPTHLYGYVERNFISGGSRDGVEPAILFGLTAPRSRAFGLTVMLECGGIYRELPPHAWTFSAAQAPWTLSQAQRWDCFGGSVEVIEYSYLRGLSCNVLPGKHLNGEYLFTVEPSEDGFSREPTQSKSFHFIRLDNDRLTIQPGNYLWWKDESFTKGDTPPSWLRRQTSVWQAEN